MADLMGYQEHLEDWWRQCPGRLEAAGPGSSWGGVSIVLKKADVIRAGSLAPAQNEENGFESSA